MIDADGVVRGTGNRPAPRMRASASVHSRPRWRRRSGRRWRRRGSTGRRACRLMRGSGSRGCPGRAAEALEDMDFGFARVALATDAQIASIGAHCGADGATLILGTGSIAQLRVGGTDFAIGGYGFPISDEGSGAALGLSAMRHALRALDGRTTRTPLALAIAARFGHAVPQAVAWMDRATPADYAALAPIVIQHAEADDTIARSIVEDAATHVERFIETIFERGAPSCALLGGLAPRLRPWLRERDGGAAERADGRRARRRAAARGVRRMSTEAADPRYVDIDGWPAVEMAAAVLAGQGAAVAVVDAGAVAAAAEAAARRLRGGGGIGYAGAGTSGSAGGAGWGGAYADLRLARGAAGVPAGGRGGGDDARDRGGGGRRRGGALGRRTRGAGRGRRAGRGRGLGDGRRTRSPPSRRRGRRAH
ncbi:BadF/BadG/BcrA/BcrD ATPase family protein [Sphingomonas sp. MMS24-JH45]